MLEKRVDVRGARIRTLESGSGVPLLLLPSASGRAAEYRELIPKLENNFHLYAIDYPGFGQSDDAPEITGLTGLSEFVAAWMDAVGVRQSHVLGFSMGGWIALSLALSHPDRVTRLILVATSAGILPDVPICNPSGMNFMEILDRFYYRPEIKTKLARQKLSAEEKAEIFRSSRAFDRLVQGGEIAPALYPRLSEIRARTLVIGAEQDRAVPLPYQERLHAGI
ncbi:MAG: alpha/beta fold hydrolase, partial [Nitrospiria bacterium]